MSVYDSRIWKIGRTLLPQPIRLKLRVLIIRLNVLYKSAVLNSYSANGEDLLIKSLIGDRRDVWYYDIEGISFQVLNSINAALMMRSPCAFTASALSAHRITSWRPR